VSTDSTVQNYFETGFRSVLLGTATIDICHLWSNFKARALINSGCEATFISELLFRLIRLPCLIQTDAESKKFCQFIFRSPNRPSLQINTTVYALPELAEYLPSYPFPQQFLWDLPNCR